MRSWSWAISRRNFKAFSMQLIGTACADPSFVAGAFGVSRFGVQAGIHPLVIFL